MASLGENRKTDYEFSQRFIDYMRSVLPDAKIASGGKELITKCKYCADKKGHMYIKVPQSAADASVFNCFLCHASGIVDSRRLMEWSIYSPEIGGALDSIEKESYKRKKISSGDYHRIIYTFNNAVYNKDLAAYKLAYINNRLGLNLSLYDALNNKIILNLKDALDYNNETIWNGKLKYTRSPGIINQLNDNFVGFLSLDNNFINLRRINDNVKLYESIDSRYINYNIHSKQDNTEKFYVMPTVINLVSGNRIQIHIAEGPFDILSIRFNLRKDPNALYASINGSGYRGLINTIINSLKIYYFDLHLYPDNDKHGNDYIMNDIANYVRPYGGLIYIHRNIMPGEKDFGVSLNRISETIQTI